MQFGESGLVLMEYVGDERPYTGKRTGMAYTLKRRFYVDVRDTDGNGLLL